jgi:hypothetical protein
MSLEYPEQSYYPSAKVRLIIRFDEFATNVLDPKKPTKVTTKLKGINDPAGIASTVGLDPDAPPGVTRYKLTPVSGPAPGGPQRQDTSADDLTHIVGGIIPKKMEIGINGIRIADTGKLEFRFMDLPIDPRVVRACGVQAYLGTVSAEDYIAGNEGGVRAGTAGSSGDGEPLNVIPDTYTDENGQTRTNLRFEGWVDEWEVEVPDQGEPTVRMTCRDNTTMLIDTDAPPGLHIDVTTPIDKAIANYLTHFASFAGLKIEYRGATGADVPTLKASMSKTSYSDQGGASPNKGAGAGGGTAAKLSVWDHLTDLVGILGHTIRVEGTVIVIQRIRNITGQNASARAEDPFQGRTLSSGRNIPVRLFLYGRNLKEMKFGRKYGKRIPKGIQVNAYSHHEKHTIIERFPSSDSPLITKANPGDGHNETEYQVIRIDDIIDRGTLKVIAQSYFESLGRNELTVGIKTVNLASFGGGNLDPDILDMKAGDTIEVLVNRDEDDTNTITTIENVLLAQGRAEEFMRTTGYGPRIAKAYAKAYTDAGFQTRFKVKNLNLNWDIEQSITIDISAVNFIEVRIKETNLPDGST